MLSDDAINNLIQPIIARQEAINTYVIQQIAKRLKEIGTLLKSDIYKLERLLKMGGDVKKINQEIARLTFLQEQDIKRVIATVSKIAYTETKPFYDYRHKAFIPFDKNTPLQRRVKALTKITINNTCMNLSKSQATGFLIRDLKNPSQLKFYNIEQTYQTVMDEAIQASQGGVIDYGTAMRRTLKQLTDSGVRRMYWDSGYTQRLDTAVKRNLLGGIKEINQAVQDITGEQFGADGKEITVHANSAPDHEPIQGHQFTNEEWEKLQSAQPFKDVNGVVFSSVERAIGTLNCRHFAYSIIVGVSKPIYTPEQLQKMIEDNHKGYTLPNGKHLTLYECSQRQRQMETEIRKAKDGQIACRAAGDRAGAEIFQIRINKLSNDYKSFSSACGLSPKPGNMSVPGYRKISVK